MINTNNYASGVTPAKGLGVVSDPPPLPSNPNARSINFALYLVLFAMRNTFDNGLFKNQRQLADFLSAQGFSAADISSFMTVVTQLEEADPTNSPSFTGAGIAGFRQMWNNVFGANATFDQGHIVPAAGSALANYIQMLQAQNPGSPTDPYDYHSDALYQQFDHIAGYINGATVTGWYYNVATKAWTQETDPVSLLQMLQQPNRDVYVTIDVMVGNHWQNNNGHPNGTGPDYLGDLYASDSSILQTAGGLTQDKYSTMNQNNNEIKTIYQVLQDAIRRSSESL